jgi:thiamine pyrophosphokinase
MQQATVLVANGPVVWSPQLRELALSAAVVVAADGGANHLREVGLCPVAVIGDLDSLAPATRRWVGETRIVHRPDQDRTDLDKALEWTFTEAAQSPVTVLGALGGRIDHALANLGLLARHARGDRLVYRDPHTSAVAVTGLAELPAAPGETWSFLTFDPSVRVTVRGVEWEVVAADLAAATTPSVSNRATGHRVVVEASGGAVLAIRTVQPG